MSAPPTSPLPPYRTGIDCAWIDYNGHLRDAYYGLIVSHATDAVMDSLGLDAGYRGRTQCTLYTLEMHLHYLHEVKSTDAVEVETSVLDADQKRLHLGCRFTCGRIADTLAAAEVMLLHVRQGDIPRSTVFPVDIGERLQALKLSDEARATWGPASRRMEIKRRPAA